MKSKEILNHIDRFNKDLLMRQGINGKGLFIPDGVKITEDENKIIFEADIMTIPEMDNEKYRGGIIVKSMHNKNSPVPVEESEERFYQEVICEILKSAIIGFEYLNSLPQEEAWEIMKGKQPIKSR